MNHEEAIVIDIDGVIAGVAPFDWDYSFCPCMAGAKEAIDTIRKEYVVILHTGRHVNWALITIKWLKEHKIKYDHIQFGKPPAILYIDDKGMEHKSWEKTLKQMRKGKIIKTLVDTQSNKH